MSRQRSKDLESIANNTRLQFVRHELQRGLDMALRARAEQVNGNTPLYEHYKTKAAKTHDDFQSYLTGISATLAAFEEQQLQADLLALRAALDALK